MTSLDVRSVFLIVTPLLFLLGAVSGIFLGRLNRPAGTQGALTGALLGGLAAAGGAIAFWQQPMTHGRTILTLVAALPGGASEQTFPELTFSVYVDRLAAFFLLLTGVLSALVALYSFVWLAGKPRPHRIAGIYNLFVLAALILLVGNNVYLFLLALESLTLTFSYLALYRHDTLLATTDEPSLRGAAAPKQSLVSIKIASSQNPLLAMTSQLPSSEQTREMTTAKLAFKVYLIFSHVGVVFVTAALLLLALAARSFDFDALRGLNLVDQPALAGAIFLLALAGFGIKGGFVGAHPWVAIVHPYSPTTTHALTLGFIIKVSAFYLLLRVLFEFLQPVQAWWGWLVLLVAGLTALVGVFDALTGRDLKTALANHSVENIGIILGGIGVALMFTADGQDARAPLVSLGLVASLYHMLNHAVFKGLLYLGTGAIENRTGTVMLEKLGGLMRRYPWTATTFLVGAAAIAGFPPFNGFISEWLTLQALFAGLTAHTASGPLPWSAASLLAALLMLGTAFGLTALAFTKIAGEALLGAPRDVQVANQAKTGDVPWPMRSVLVLLALLCLLLGLFPGAVVRPLALIAQDLGGSAVAWPSSPITALTLAVPLDNSPDLYTARLDLAPLLLLAAAPLTIAGMATLRIRRAQRGPVWNCGTPYTAETMQMTGGAFAFLVWERFGGRRRSAGVPAMGGQPQATRRREENLVLWRLPLSATHYVVEFFRLYLDSAATGGLNAAQRFGDWFQGGDIRRYLGYLFAIFALSLAIALSVGSK